MKNYNKWKILRIFHRREMDVNLKPKKDESKTLLIIIITYWYAPYLFFKR